MKYRFLLFCQWAAYAFYPLETLMVCAVFTAATAAVLAVLLSYVQEGTTAYNVLFALTTGAVVSFFVSLIVELTNNYRHNKLGWYELADYYDAIAKFEQNKQLMENEIYRWEYEWATQ